MRRSFSPFNLRAVDGKKYGRASENFKVTQTLCGSEIPPCFPAARRSQRSVKIFAVTIVKTIAVVTTPISKRPSRFMCDLPRLLPPASCIINLSSLFAVTPNDKTTPMPRRLAAGSEGSKTKYSLGFMRRGGAVPDSHCGAGSSSTHTNR
jgi:hypothetical protein